MMLTTRRRKQISYGVGYVLFFGFVAGLLVLLVRGSRPHVAEPPAPTPAFAPIRVEEVQTIEHSSPLTGSSVDIVVRLHNPNARAGVADYRVLLSLVGQRGQVLQEEMATTYLLPGEVAYAVKLGVAVVEPPARVEVTLPENPVFTTIPASIARPSLSTILRDRVKRNIGDTVSEEQKGTVTNTSSLDWQFVEVLGLALTAESKIVGVGQTFIGELKVGETREFTLQWPATRDNISRVFVLPTTNIYRQENIVRAIGDPSLLR